MSFISKAHAIVRAFTRTILLGVMIDPLSPHSEGTPTRMRHESHHVDVDGETRQTTRQSRDSISKTDMILVSLIKAMNMKSEIMLTTAVSVRI